MLDLPTWTARRDAHRRRVDEWVVPAEERARRQEPHPVEDFLFTYYSQRRGALRRWSPGPSVVLADADPAQLGAGFVATTGGAELAPAPERVQRTASWVADLLARTASRPASFGCFGLHEWAMVHGSEQSTVRHSAYPLRLGSAGTTAVVESMPVRCTHFDAFRFFTPSARPLNAVQPTRETQAAMEQGGCLHANMDLYKWAYKLSPWVESELVADCFELARRVRELDMRASPYDLSELGYAPVEIETAAGRAEYAAAQRAFAAEAAALRARLLPAARRLTGSPAAGQCTQGPVGTGRTRERARSATGETSPTESA
ncbi:3-methyladenine DNA glycosylase [Motilibacter peucedani]|uniref:3-methyladenine DNA glycosylase n=1 Tax=Motilibacter peucedani TaxID=598650 RepID=UPI0038B3A7BB